MLRLCKCTRHDCLKLAHHWALHGFHLLVQVRIKFGSVACCLLYFKSDDGLFCAALGCYDSKLEILYRPCKSCCHASLVGFDHR